MECILWQSDIFMTTHQISIKAACGDFIPKVLYHSEFEIKNYILLIEAHQKSPKLPLVKMRVYVYGWLSRDPRLEASEAVCWLLGQN